MDRSKCPTLLLCNLLFSLVCTPVYAQVYQWEDENGVIHFSDRPTGKAKQVNLIDLNKQADNKDGKKQIKRNKEWFKQRSQQRYKAEVAAAKAGKKKNKAAAKHARACKKLSNKLADMRDKYRSQKRKGISYKAAQKQKQAIELQRNKIKREC